MCARQAPGPLSCPGLGRAQDAGPTESAPVWRPREPEPERLRPGKCTQPGARLRQFPAEQPGWRLSSVDRGSAHAWAGQTQGGPETASTSHTVQGCLFAVFLPPRSTTEQVSLNKWPPPSPCVRAEIRDWRDLQTEEAKSTKREPLWKWQVQQIKTLQLAAAAVATKSLQPCLTLCDYIDGSPPDSISFSNAC